MREPCNIRYVGVDDTQIDLFEGMFPVPHGMAYNSYVLLDEKTAVMDAVDAHFTALWLDRLAQALEGRTADYLIVHHMEPDHSAGVAAFMERYPEAVVVASDKAFGMMKAFLGEDYASRRLVVGEGSALPLGAHTLRFLTAPMVHWPEVIMTWVEGAGVLFTADAFGRFGALAADVDWEGEARRYYHGIVGKFGMQVQRLLSRVGQLPVKMICPLHGPVLHAPLEGYLQLYDRWSSGLPEEAGVTIAVASVYGHTREAAALLARKLREGGCGHVALYDLNRCDLSAAAADAFRFDTLVLASTTYNGDLLPPMHAFLRYLTARNFDSRRVALMENGSWAPAAARLMREQLCDCRNLTLVEHDVRILSALNEDSRRQVEALAETLLGR